MYNQIWYESLQIYEQMYRAGTARAWKHLSHPLVGSVVVSNNKVIGSAGIKKQGEPHAEVHAIRSVQDTSALPTSTLYVNLEPCSHHGKTPPCTDLIIQSGIRHVVVGMLDPFKKVNGQGLRNWRCRDKS